MKDDAQFRAFWNMLENLAGRNLDMHEVEDVISEIDAYVIESSEIMSDAEAEEYREEGRKEGAKLMEEFLRDLHPNSHYRGWDSLKKMEAFVEGER